VSGPIEVLRAWEGGPLREFAAIRPKPGWGIPYDGPKPYANSYVCDECGKPCVGVYFLRAEAGDAQIALATLTSVDPMRCRERVWVCGACRSALLPKQAPAKVFKSAPKPKHLGEAHR
jgi:hypothetical protein